MEHIRIHTRDAGALFLAVLLWQGISVSVRGTRLSPKHGNSDLNFQEMTAEKRKGAISIQNLAQIHQITATTLYHTQ